MQATVDGVNLDNGTWRRVVGQFGDDTGLDGRRVLAVDFIIEADSAATLASRYKATRDDFIKVNPRATLTLDDTGGEDWADVSPSDGFHTSTRTTVGIAAGHEQTGNSHYCRLYILADTSPPNAGGAGGGAASGLSTYKGLQGTLRRTISYNAGRVQSRAVLATFVTTFEYNTATTYTINSVASGGGFAVFTFAEAPTAFSAGMKLKVLTSTGAYLGVHVVTAVNVGAKTVTTATAYSASVTGTAQLGTQTTGLANYTAAKAAILADHLLTDNDGSRNASSGMVLTVDKEEDLSEDGNEVQVLLQSEYQEVELANTAGSRGLVVNISHSRPDRWHPGGGTTPRFLMVTGHFFVDRDTLGASSLHEVFESTARAEIEAYVKSESGENRIRLLQQSFASSRKDHRVEFALRYQARNVTVIDFKRSQESREDDDTVHYKAGKYDYEQRPEGLPPKTITVTVSRIGLNRQTLNVPAPSGESGGAVYRPIGTSTSEEEADTPFGRVWIQTKAVGFVRRVYEGGGGVEVVKA